MSISALIICRNEDRVIGRCLQSLRGVIDEVLLIHDGICEDNTLKIAREYTSNIFESDIRRGLNNSWFIDGIEKCHADWVLIIDADEFLSEELRQNIQQLTNDPSIDGYSFLWPMWNGEKYISVRALRKNFLFRKSRMGFLDKFHLPVRVLGTICASNYVVHHKPMYNNWTDETFDRKQKNWAVLQAKDHLKPINECRILRLSKDELRKEQKLKNFLYNWPLLTGVMAYLVQIKRLISDPYLAVDKGFWISTKYGAKYSTMSP